MRPSNRPTRRPSNKPTNMPTNKPTNKPSRRPSNKPTKQPTQLRKMKAEILCSALFSKTLTFIHLSFPAEIPQINPQ